MKKYFPFYLYPFLVLFSLTAQAMDNNQLQTVQEITTNGSSLAAYEAYKDSKGDRKRLAVATQLMQKDCITFSIPLDIFLHNIFPFLDSESLHSGVKLTCRTFYELSSMSRINLLEKDPLQALRRITISVLPLISYEGNEDRKGDKERLSATNQLLQNDCAILSLPLDIILHNIFPSLDSETFNSGVKLTCRFFCELPSMSRFCLNEYCLTETRPHAMPLDILCFKTCKTKGGIFKLAALMSVSATDLKNWFEPDFLQAAFLPYQNSLPAQLEGQSEEDLGKLYPILKVALASPLVDTADTSNPVIKLLQEYPYPYGLSLNKMRLLSLSPTRPGVYYETLQQLINSPCGYSRDSSSEIRNAIARELLRAGKNVAGINNCFFVYCNPLNKGAAIQILELCVHNPQFYHNHNVSQLISDAFFLERPDLALKILREVVELPNDVNSLPYKIWSFVNYKDREIEDEQVQSRIQQFLTNLYSFWGQLPGYIKFPALSLLMHSGRRDEVQMAMDDILLQSEEEVLKSFPSNVCSDFCDYDYPEEAEKLIRYLLNVETNKVITAFSQCSRDKDDIFTQFMKVDREKSVVLLKAFIESGQVNMRDKIEALTFLTEHAIEEIDREKSTSLLKAFIEVESDQVNRRDRIDAHIFLAKHAIEASDREKSISFIKDCVESGQLDIDAELNALWFLAQHATEEIDRKKSISRIKLLSESDQCYPDNKLGFLALLAQNVPEEKDYVIAQIKCLEGEITKRDNGDQMLCVMYYYLGDQALCGFHYQKMIQKMLNKTDLNSMEVRAKRLKKLQEGGFHVERVEDLVDCDPFKVISILSGNKKIGA
jgi:hypothetical protein